MNYSIIFLFILLMGNSPAIAQPGPYTGTLKFKVFKDGKMVDLSAKNWKINTAEYTTHDKSILYQFPHYYQLTPKATPVGGMVSENFYLDIIFKKDTMKIFTPDFSSQNVILDSIPFSKGTFKIPQHIYDLKHMTDHKFESYTPKIDGDWNLFKKETHRCIVEKMEDIDAVNFYSAGYTGKFDKIIIQDKYYYFKDNVVIKAVDDKNKYIYQVKDINAVTFWNTRLKENELIIKSLFYKEKSLFAIIEKHYSSSPVGTSCGIYKLHLIEDEVPEELAMHLKSKQLTEDYNALVKFMEKFPRYWVGYDLVKIKAEYEKRVNTVKIN